MVCRGPSIGTLLEKIVAEVNRSIIIRILRLRDCELEGLRNLMCEGLMDVYSRKACVLLLHQFLLFTYTTYFAELCFLFPCANFIWIMCL